MTVKPFGLGRMVRAAAGLLLVAVMACAPIYESHGYVPSDQELALIEVGRDDRAAVEATIGRPTTRGLLNDVGWFYVQSEWKTYGVRAPQEIDRQVVAITFDDKGIVENIERFGLEDGKIVVLSRRVTTPNVKGQSFLRQLFGNIGRVSAEQLLK